MSSYKQYRSFGEVEAHIPWANRFNYEGIIVSLANERERLIARIIELEAIAPFKVRLPSGQVAVWQCPEELIPFKPDVLFSK